VVSHIDSSFKEFFKDIGCVGEVLLDDEDPVHLLVALPAGTNRCISRRVLGYATGRGKMGHQASCTVPQEREAFNDDCRGAVWRGA
jgi:hypothetical protein